MLLPKFAFDVIYTWNKKIVIIIIFRWCLNRYYSMISSWCYYKSSAICVFTNSFLYSIFKLLSSVLNKIVKPEAFYLYIIILLFLIYPQLFKSLILKILFYSSKNKLCVGRRGLVGLFVNKFTTTPRVEGSNPGLSLYSLSVWP